MPDPIRLGYSRASAPSALLIAEASNGQITAVREGPCDVNWGRRRSLSATLNRDISNAANKRVMRELFQQGNVPTPRLLGDSPEVGEGVVVLGRPDFHARGRGFWRCDTADAVNVAKIGTRRKMPATHFMEWLDTENEYTVEWRVHIFNGKSIRMSVKDIHSDDRHDYTTVKPSHFDVVRKPVREAARKAVAAVGVDFGAVDILTRSDGRDPKVLEVNCAPGLGGSMPKVYADKIMETLHGRE